MATELLSAKELAKYLGVSPSTIHYWAKEHGLPHHRTPVGRYRKFDAREVVEWLDARESEIPAPELRELARA